MFLFNPNTIITSPLLTIIPWYHLIPSPCSNFPNCPKMSLYCWFVQNSIMLHVTILLLKSFLSPSSSLFLICWRNSQLSCRMSYFLDLSYLFLCFHLILVIYLFLMYLELFYIQKGRFTNNFFVFLSSSRIGFKVILPHKTSKRIYIRNNVFLIGIFKTSF